MKAMLQPPLVMLLGGRRMQCIVMYADDGPARALGMPGASYAMEIGARMLPRRKS